MRILTLFSPLVSPARDQPPAQRLTPECGANALAAIDPPPPAEFSE